MARRKVETQPEIYVEGNNGGDYLKIALAGENLVRLEVGNCCVHTITAIVPVEFITGVLTDAVLRHNGDVPGAIMALDWPDDFKRCLCAQVQEVQL